MARKKKSSRLKKPAVKVEPTRFGTPAHVVLEKLRNRRRLSPEDAEDFARIIEEARAALPPLTDPWTRTYG